MRVSPWFVDYSDVKIISNLAKAELQSVVMIHPHQKRGAPLRDTVQELGHFWRHDYFKPDGWANQVAN